MDREEVIRIIREAIGRADDKVKHRIEMDDIIPYLEEVSKEDIGNEAFYYIVMGIAWEYQIPLSPKQVKRIREILGISEPAP